MKRLLAMTLLVAIMSGFVYSTPSVVIAAEGAPPGQPEEDASATDDLERFLKHRFIEVEPEFIDVCCGEEDHSSQEYQDAHEAIGNLDEYNSMLPDIVEELRIESKSSKLKIEEIEKGIVGLEKEIGDLKSTLDSNKGDIERLEALIETDIPKFIEDFNALEPQDINNSEKNPGPKQKAAQDQLDAITKVYNEVSGENQVAPRITSKTLGGLGNGEDVPSFLSDNIVKKIFALIEKNYIEVIQEAKPAHDEYIKIKGQISDKENAVSKIEDNIELIDSMIEILSGSIPRYENWLKWAASHNADVSAITEDITPFIEPFKAYMTEEGNIDELLDAYRLILGIPSANGEPEPYKCTCGLEEYFAKYLTSDLDIPEFTVPNGQDVIEGVPGDDFEEGNTDINYVDSEELTVLRAELAVAEEQLINLQYLIDLFNVTIPPMNSISNSEINKNKPSTAQTALQEKLNALAAAYSSIMGGSLGDVVITTNNIGDIRTKVNRAYDVARIAVSDTEGLIAYINELIDAYVVPDWPSLPTAGAPRAATMDYVSFDAIIEKDDDESEQQDGDGEFQKPGDAVSDTPNEYDNQYYGDSDNQNYGDYDSQDYGGFEANSSEFEE